jgi:hypothetical protein
MIERPSTTRVLAIDPTTKGFAYVIFEGPEFLLEWGLSQARADAKNAKCVRGIEKLLARYSPDVVILEDYEGAGSHRRPRVRALIRSIEGLARRRGIRERSFSRRDIRRAFDILASPTKHSIATELAKRYPELAPRLPSVRKCYESEDERTNLFDAASLALTYFERHRRRSKLGSF